MRCPECDGTGFSIDDKQMQDINRSWTGVNDGAMHALAEMLKYSCDRCGGTGEILDEPEDS
jgi:hypothetical protein